MKATNFSAIRPTIEQLKAGAMRYDRGDRPWVLSFVDWHILLPDGKLRPLKYLFGLATDIRPSSLTTNQIKSAVRHLGLPLISLRLKSDAELKLQADVRSSMNDKSGRRMRLAAANQIPTEYIVAQRVFRRNPDVIAEVQERANGNCESCGCPTPFIRASDGSPYLEVHHIIQLSKGGLDIVSNAKAVCPNCHRRAHLG